MPVLDSVTLWGGGKQPEDKHTRELPGLEDPAPTVKRGRGRPRLDNPRSPAERSRAYRMRKRVAKRLNARLIANGITGIYRGPNGETWTGRGLMPKWLHYQVRNGVDKQLFYVTL